MHDAVSLKKRLVISLWLMLLLGLLLPFWFYHRSFDAEIISVSQRAVIQQMDHLAWLVTNEKSFQNINELNDWLSQAGRNLGLRITYIDLDGRTLADSQLSPDEISAFENLSARPEFLQAMAKGSGLAIRLSKVTQQEHIFIARKIALKGPIPPGILRIASPFSPIKNVLDRATGGFIILLFAIFIVSLLISWALIRRLKLPIAEMTNAVESVGTGDFSVRIPGRDQELYPLALGINRMADNVARQIKKISSRQQQLDAVFNGMQEAVMVLSPKGKVIEVNQAFCELIAPLDACIGKNPLEIIRNLELQEACDRILSHAATDNTIATEIQLSRDRTFNVTIARMSEHSKDLGAIVVFHEVSNIKRLEKVRQDFVSNVSRELTAPLISIKTHVEKVLAESECTDEKIRSSLNSVLTENSHLLSIAQDLLQLAALDSSPARIQSASANPAKALTTAWDVCRSTAVAKNIGLESNLPEDGIDVAVGVEELAQVFRNLIGNAIKYSPEGGRLTAGFHSEGQRIIFSIQDEGPGIPRQHQDRIFERFYRASKPISGAQASSGLGLAIAKHIVQNHGGSLWVQSPNPGRQNGATFFFSMHIAKEEKELNQDLQENILH